MTTWYCHLVGQEQSAAGRKKYGAHPDAGQRRPVKAGKTEFAGATLELKPDGTYTLAAPEFAPTNSHGTWSSKDDVLVVTQAKDCINGHEGVQYVRSSGDAVVFAFRLVADAHDGLDTLVLTFRREAPAEAVPAGGFIEQLLAAKNETDLFEVLKTITPDEWPGRARQMWDAWVEGRLPRKSLSCDRRVARSDAFTFVHARHAFTEPPKMQDGLTFMVQGLLVQLPGDDAAERELAGLVSDEWLRYFASFRFLGGSQLASLYARPMLPQPRANDIARTFLREQTTFGCFDGIDVLYPDGDAELVNVVWRYSGHELLKKPLALIEARGIGVQVLDATTVWLADETRRDAKLTPKDVQASTALLRALMWNVFLSCRLGREISKATVSGLRVKLKYAQGAPTNEEKDMLRALALPEKTAALFKERLSL